MFRRALIALTGITLVVGLAACAPLVPEKASSAGSTPASSTVSAKVTQHKVGEAVDVGKVRIQVKKVSRLPITSVDVPQKDHSMFVAVDLAITNGSSKTQAINNLLLQLNLKDAQGHQANPTIHSKAKDPPAEQLEPGAKTSGQIVYVVPKSAKGLKLVYDASSLGGGQVVWTIGDALKI